MVSGSHGTASDAEKTTANATGKDSSAVTSSEGKLVMRFDTIRSIAFHFVAIATVMWSHIRSLM
jgi:hypothetical protein